MKSFSKLDLAYATPRERALISLALAQAAEEAKTLLTAQSRTEEYGRNRVIDSLREAGAKYLEDAEGAQTDGVVPWNDLSSADRLYWEHEGRAVLRAAERDGFRERDGDTMGEWVYQRFGNRH